MKRTAVLLLVLLATACTRPEATVAFNQVCAPPAADSCTFPATCNLQNLDIYQLDVGQSGRLWVVIEMKNQHPNNEDLPSGRVNTGDAFVEEIEVSYIGGLPDLRYRTQGRIPAAGTTVLSVFPLDGVPATAVAAGTSRVVVAKVKAKGTFGDGGTFETAELEIPVTLCNGCLGPPPACVDPAAVLSTCPPDSWGQTPVSAGCK